MPEKSEPLVERIKQALLDIYSKPFEERLAERFPGGEERGKPFTDRLEAVRGVVAQRVDEPVTQALRTRGRLANRLADAFQLPQLPESTIELDDEEK